MSLEKSKIGRPRLKETMFSTWIDEHPSWTRQTLAKALGITRQYIDAICRGDRTPSEPLQKLIALVTKEQFPENHWNQAGKI